MAANLKLVDASPEAEMQTVGERAHGRRTNEEYGRTREYLTEAEVETLAATARKNSQGLRDWLMVTLAYRHGLRASELVDLQRSDIDLARRQHPCASSEERFGICAAVAG